jgi:hypothetical protein
MRIWGLSDGQSLFEVFPGILHNRWNLGCLRVLAFGHLLLQQIDHRLFAPTSPANDF